MELKSNAFEHAGAIPAKYTCQGIDISPPLTISGVPEGAVFLALIMEDPDVPKNLKPDGMWDHWLIYNIDPKRTEIAEGVKGFGVEGFNTGGSQGYQGPCPPDREHRYFFKLFALDCVLTLPDNFSKDGLIAAMEGHVLAHCELMGTYDKS